MRYTAEWDNVLRLGLLLPGVKPGFIERSDRASDVLGKYSALGLAPGGHVIDLLRPKLRGRVATADISGLADGEQARVAGRMVRWQRTLGRAAFLALEYETGLAPVVM